VLAVGQDSFNARVVALAQHPRMTTDEVIDKPSNVPAPNLSIHGYRLVDKRSMQQAGHHIVEFTYHKRRGNDAFDQDSRIRIYAEKQQPEQSPAPSVVSKQGVLLARWRQGNIRYALVGDMPRTSLQALARSIKPDALRGEVSRLAG